MNVGLWNAIDWSCCACSLIQSCKIRCIHLCSEKCQILLLWINKVLSFRSLWSCDHGGIFEALQSVIVWCEGLVCMQVSITYLSDPPFFLESRLTYTCGRRVESLARSSAWIHACTCGTHIPLLSQAWHTWRLTHFWIFQKMAWQKRLTLMVF